MKKISLLKKLGLGLGTSAAIVPLVFSLSSCANKSIDVQYISFNDFASSAPEGKLIDKMNVSHFGYDTLLLGSKKFYNGNYFLFVGSNTFDTTVKFFGGPNASRDTKSWLTEYLSDSYWNIDVIARSKNQDLIDMDFGFVTFIDDFDFKFYDEKDHEIVVYDKNQGILGPVSPFQKWTKDLIVQTKDYNRTMYHYEWDDESVDENDYIRQDASAKAYREFCQRGLSFFPTVEGGRTKSFDVGDGNSTSLMLVYKDGKLKDILDLPTQSYTGMEQPEDNDPKTLYGAIYKYFPLEEPEEPEPEPQPQN